MKISVENCVTVEAEINLLQIYAYLKRTGWTLHEDGHLWQTWGKGEPYGESDCPEHVANLPLRADYRDYELCIGRFIHEVAMAEERTPSDVLLDISKEKIEEML